MPLIVSAVDPTPIPGDPCKPNPCGPNSVCQAVSGSAACSCIPGYFGSPCRPECTSNSQCSLRLACVNQKCVDVCPGTCGEGGECTIVNHNPICTCPPGTTGDAFRKCVEVGKLKKHD